MDQHYIDAPTIWNLLQRRAQVTPNAPMLFDAEGRSWSFLAVAREVERHAAGLQQRGIGPGSMVTWQMPSSVTTLFLSFALARLGAIQNPVIHLYGKKEAAAIVRQNQPAFYIVGAGMHGAHDGLAFAASACEGLARPPQVLLFDDRIASDAIANLPPAPGADGVARWIYTTSGTTSEPKGVCHTDATLLASGYALARALGCTAQDIGSITFPYAHVGGAMYTIMLLTVGMSAVMLTRFVATEAVEVFRRLGVTASGGSTAHYLAFLGEQRKQPGTPLLPALTMLSGGGAAKPPELYFQVRSELRCVLVHCYGMTEAPMITGGSRLHSDEQLAHSDGAPVTGMQIRIVREDDAPALPGEAGEIRLKGPTVCQGYMDAAQTAQAFDQHGYFRTGDIGVLRADGHLAITGRLKDVIIRKGENIAAREIEEILLLHPKVAAVAVIGLPDAERGERVCAVIELRNAQAPLGFSEMVDFFNTAGTMRQKIPEQLETVDQLPRNETFNKVLKFKLRERFGPAA